MLEPKTRGVEPEVLMETLFRATPLESRFPLNMNVLTADRTPVVMGLRDVITAWLAHREEVLQRRSRHRLAAIERRLEILEGYLAVFLNLDEVIRIIRNEDEPKPALIAAFSLTDMQAEAILNMRLRSLRRLEEMEIRKEHKSLTRERRDLQALLKDAGLRRDRIAGELEETRAKFGSGPLGARRTTLAAAPAAVVVLRRRLRRARADHRHPLAEGLGARRARPSRGWRRSQVQGRRQAAPAGALRDHRPALPVRHEWPRLHAARRRPAARPRRRAADPPARRARQRG